MKLESKIWLKLESKGKPLDTQTHHVSVRESVLLMAGWLSEVYMGSKIVITLARTESDLNESKRDSVVTDMMAELNGILADRPDFQSDESSPESQQTIGVTADNRGS